MPESRVRYPSRISVTVVLPAPLGPSSAKHSPSVDLEGGTVQGPQVAVALADVGHAHCRLAHADDHGTKRTPTTGRYAARVRIMVARCRVDYVGQAHRPPARGHPGDHGQGRRLGADPLRRRLLQAAQLDEPALHDPHRRLGRGRAPSRSGPSRTRRGSSWSSASTRCCTPPTTSSASIPGLVKDGVEAHLQKLLAEQVGRAGRGLAAGAAGVPDGDRAGRPHVPRRRRARGRRRDQASRRDRRGRAARPATSSC